MSNQLRARGAIAAVALMAAACGGGGESTDDPTDTTAPETQTTATAPAGADTTTSTEAAPSGDDEGSVTVTVDGTTYELSPTGFNTRCDPDFFGTGQFWVVAAAFDEDGEFADPQISLNLSLYPMGQADDELEFELGYRPSDDSSQTLDYVLATQESVVFQAGEFDGDLGSWTIEGNRIHGEVTVWESDHIREYFTATFDITCPPE